MWSYWDWKVSVNLDSHFHQKSSILTHVFTFFLYRIKLTCFVLSEDTFLISITPMLILLNFSFIYVDYFKVEKQQHGLILLAGWETKKFWHSPELGSFLYSLYKIPLAQACFPLARPNFHSHWRVENVRLIYIQGINFFHHMSFRAYGWVHFHLKMDQVDYAVKFILCICSKLKSSSKYFSLLIAFLIFWFGTWYYLTRWP